MSKWVAASLMALSMGLAGCIAEDNGSGKKAGSANAPSVSLGGDQGFIQGKVLNEEQLPVEGGRVDVADPPMAAEADESGKFVVGPLNPGKYTVYASGLGYQSAAKEVEVNAGQATPDIIFILQALPSDQPYHKTDIKRVLLTGLMWKLTPTCIYPGLPVPTVGPLIKTCGGVRSTCGDPDQCETHYGTDKEFTPEWKTLVGEVTWQQQSALTGKGFHYDINAPNITRGSGGSINQADPYTWHKSSNKAPLVIRIDNPATLEERKIKADDYYGDWFWRLFPAAYDAGIGEDGFGPDFGLSYENPAEIYFTYFIKEPAAPDYTALPQK